MLTPLGGVFGRNPTFNNVTVDGTMRLPSGTTAQRPANPVAGMIRFNTTTSRTEYYSGTQWLGLQPEPLEVEFLVVAGGGGGGGNFSMAGGGGGAGGFRTNVGGVTLPVNRGTSYTVLVGAGGAAPATQASAGLNGGDSQFGTIVSSGGGGGARSNAFPDMVAGNGGSGGGAGGSPLTIVGRGNVPTQSPSQGNNGGTYAQAGSSGTFRMGAGGGGGASAVGSNGVAGTGGGAGGAGTANSITGSSVTYAGGGGGGYGYDTGQTAFAGGAGGAGGGGVGAGNGVAAGAGGANTGGGGGGGCFEGSTSRPSQAGGSGVVYVRYLGAQRATGGTVTSAGGYTIHEFTSSGTFALAADA